MKIHVLIFLGALITLSITEDAESRAQADVNYLADKLQVTFEVVDNFPDTWKTFVGRLILKNSGDEHISRLDWTIYFCSIRMFEPATIRQGNVKLGDAALIISHINGCLHKIQPEPTFPGFLPQAQIEATFVAEYWEVSRTDSMPNWYISAPGVESRVMASTSGESLSFVAPFKTENQYKRQDYDTYKPYTAQDRYTINNIFDTGMAPKHIIPTPAEEHLSNNATVNFVTEEWEILITSADVDDVAQYFSEKTGFKIGQQGEAPLKNYFRLEIAEFFKHGKSLTDEAYRLEIRTNEVIITGVGEDGLFYGIQSFLAMYENGQSVPLGTITDYPRYPYRGLHLDVARNFHSKETIIEILGIMSMYKLNKFHFHLTDDEGWRLEIPGVQELTQVGGKRCDNYTNRTCIIPQLGSLPDGSGLGSGFYTVEDYREILKFAKVHHIEVIPEFDMPGHAHAAIHAMLARYYSLRNDPMVDATQYLLSEIDDPSDYISVQYFTDNAINPCLESSYYFINHILEEVMFMHQDIQPLKVFHFGGDETPDGAWLNSTACQLLNETERSKDNLKKYFVTRIAAIAHAHGLKLAGWEDGLYDNDAPFERSSLPPDEVSIYAWSNIWEWGQGGRAYKFANADYKVVISHSTHLYFDHSQEPDPEERGFYWATRYIDTRKVFDFYPDNIYRNININRFGQELDVAEICADGKCPELQPGKRDNIIGIAGQVWCETIRTSDQLFGMLAPRVLALAERAWHRASWETDQDSGDEQKEKQRDWEEFANTLGYRELDRLEALGIAYQLPPPGARVNSRNILEVNSAYPGLNIQYRKDNKGEWKDYRGNLEMQPDDSVSLRTRSVDGKRFSRQVTLTVPLTVSESTSVQSCVELIFLLMSLYMIHHIMRA